MYAHGFYNTEDDHPALPQIQRAMDDWASSWERQREMAIHIDCKPHIFESRAWTPPRAPIPSTLAEHLIRLYVNNKTHLTATYYLDRIYGLLGISSDSHALGIVPDYSSTASISVRLTQVARSMILREDIHVLLLPLKASLLSPFCVVRNSRRSVPSTWRKMAANRYRCPHGFPIGEAIW